MSSFCSSIGTFTVDLVISNLDFSLSQLSEVKHHDHEAVLPGWRPVRVRDRGGGVADCHGAPRHAQGDCPPCYRPGTETELMQTREVSQTQHQCGHH